MKVDNRDGSREGTLVAQGIKEHLPGTGTLSADVLGSCFTPLEGPAATPEGAAAGVCTPEGVAAGVCTPEGAAEGVCTPEGAVAGVCTPEGAAAGVCTPEGAATGACTPEGAAAGACTPMGADAVGVSLRDSFELTYLPKRLKMFRLLVLLYVGSNFEGR